MKIAVDRTCYFEHFQQEFMHIAKILDIKVDIPHLNKSKRAASYVNVYTREMRKIVAHAYAEDINLFSYVFGEQPVFKV